MNKEDLIAMGLTEEQAKKVMDSLDGNFVTKVRFNEINEENVLLCQGPYGIELVEFDWIYFP